MIGEAKNSVLSLKAPNIVHAHTRQFLSVISLTRQLQSDPIEARTHTHFIVHTGLRGREEKQV